MRVRISRTFRYLPLFTAALVFSGLVMAHNCKKCGKVIETESGDICLLCLDKAKEASLIPEPAGRTLMPDLGRLFRWYCRTGNSDSFTAEL